jgi:hypothetical protein
MLDYLSGYFRICSIEVAATDGGQGWADFGKYQAYSALTDARLFEVGIHCRK